MHNVQQKSQWSKMDHKSLIKKWGERSEHDNSNIVHLMINIARFARNETFWVIFNRYFFSVEFLLCILGQEG